MSYYSLFDPYREVARKSQAPTTAGLGCDACPLNDIHPRIRKLKNLVNVKGRRAMIWAQTPGQQENRQCRNLIGPAGEFLWEVAGSVGLSRTAFDLQNVVRCWPVDVFEGDIQPRHTPTKEEIRCCSLYNDEAIQRNGGEAVVHLVLGDIAANSLFGGDYKKDNPIFWKPDWNAYVIATFHPSYLLRIGGAKAGQKFEEFRAKVRAVRSVLDNPGRFGHVLGQKYKRLRIAQLSDMLDHFRDLGSDGQYVAFDIEEDGDALLCASFAWGTHDESGEWVGESYYLPIDHQQNKAYRGSNKRVIRDWLREFLRDERIRKLAHYGASDSSALERRLKTRAKGLDRDSLYTAYFRFPDMKKYGLNHLAQSLFPEYGDYKLMPFVHGDRDENGRLRFGTVPLNILGPYNAADSELAARVDDRYYAPRMKGLSVVYIRAARQFAEMEQRGPKLDVEACKVLLDSLPKQIAALRTRLQTLAGDPTFNPGSPAQVARVLYDEFEIPTDKRSTDKDTLESMLTSGTRHKEFIQGVNDYRRLSKEEGTYVRKYMRAAEAHGGELRTVWNLTGAGTGRISSGSRARPNVINFQNLHGDPQIEDLLMSDPAYAELFAEFKRDPALRNYKRFLDTTIFLAADYAQMEIRVLANMSQDPLLIKQFRTGRDIHSQVGHVITGWPEAKIRKDRETRTSAKEVHFAIIYGKRDLHAHLTSKGIKISKREAALRKRRYFDQYTRVKALIARQIRLAEKRGYVENTLGFRRPISTYESATGGFWENQAINTPIQGEAHQILLTALGLLDVSGNEFPLLSTPVMDVHDALVFFTTFRKSYAATKQLVQLMEVSVLEAIEEIFGKRYSVPLVTEVKGGLKYGSMVEVYNTTKGLRGLPPRDFMIKWCQKYQDVRKAWI